MWLYVARTKTWHLIKSDGLRSFCGRYKTDTPKKGDHVTPPHGSGFVCGTCTRISQK